MKLTKEDLTINGVTYQIHIKNTCDMSWFVHFQRRCFKEEIRIYDIHLSYYYDDQFHDTIEEAVISGLKSLRDGEFTEILI